jgi:hypothetical protein
MCGGERNRRGVEALVWDTFTSMLTLVWADFLENF